MKKLFVILIVSIFSFSGFAQEEIKLEEKSGLDKIGKEKSDKKFGPNKTHYIHSHLNVGFMLPPAEGDGADILYGKSHIFTYGVRYKLKVVDFFAIGAGLNYTYQAWHMDQSASKLVPDDIIYDKEMIKSNNLGGDVFMRFNIGERNDKVGNYIDLGAYGEWAYGTSRETTINATDPSAPLGSEYSTATNFHLNYLEKANYGLQARVGYGKFVLFGKYRMSDIFTEEFKTAISTTDLPRLIVGIEMGMHK